MKKILFLMSLLLMALAQSGMAFQLNQKTEKTAPVANDIIGIEDSADSYKVKHIKAKNLPISTATQTALDAKSNTATTYTKTAVDTALGLKSDKATTYTKTEVDTAVGLKANQSTTYTKTEVNSAIAAIPPDTDTVLTEGQVDAYANNNGYQSRVAGTCLGRVMVGINSDGSAVCEDDNTGDAGSGEENVQSDWNVTDTGSDAYIKNKPTISGGVAQTISLSSDVITLSDGGGTVSLSAYLKSYTETDPVFTAWDKSYNDLTNKPTLFSGNYNDLTNKPTTITAGQVSAITANTAKITYPASASTKLAGIATGATANSTDALLRDRTTHTGTQAIATVTGLQAALDTKMDDVILQTGQVGEVLLPEDPTNGVNTVGFAAPANLASNITFRLPAILGAVGDGFKITSVASGVAVLAHYHIPVVTVSASQPSGGSHGDVWYVVQ